MTKRIDCSVSIPWCLLVSSAGLWGAFSGVAFDAALSLQAGRSSYAVLMFVAFGLPLAFVGGLVTGASAMAVGLIMDVAVRRLNHSARFRGALRAGGAIGSSAAVLLFGVADVTSPGPAIAIPLALAVAGGVILFIGSNSGVGSAPIGGTAATARDA
ncbi:hypothetical protein N1032_21315 [Herbiconiux sp. CPCC 203386]|uniref:MFS transporter n=1 Tax=Herbiconiux daphne TaxID=2970914 RepID=A0ABT2H8P0_9MICO|nr:hypothetical protein [Herbiconiux daphne]